MTTEINNVKRFADTLSLGIYDKKLEMAGKKILFFYDADVVVNIIQGFECEYPTPVRGYSKQRLIRALLSCNYLGQINILRPHALELFKKIKNLPSHKESINRKLFLEKALVYVKKTHIEDDLQVLLDIVKNIRGNKKNSEKLYADFIYQLSKKSGKSFGYLEQLNGTWTERLRRIYDSKLLTLDNMGPETSEIVNNSKNILFSINNSMETRGPFNSLNSFHDAVALTILHEEIRKRDRGETEVSVRFYTETVSLINEIQSKQIRDLFIYQEPIGDKHFLPSLEETILRDFNYYLIRIMFNELSIDNQKETSLKDLEVFSKKLNAILSDTSSNFEDPNIEEHVEKKIISLEYQGKTLMQLITDFENLSILKPLWIEGKELEIMKEIEVLENWTKIYELAKEKKTETVIHKNLSDIWEKMEIHLSRIETWSKDFKKILKVIPGNKVKLEYRSDDPMRDIGLIRWGYHLTDKEKEIIVSEIEKISTCEPYEVTNISAILATKIDYGRKEISDCIVICPILWALNLFEEIVDLILDCQKNNPNDFPPELEIMKAAALMRIGNFESDKDIEVLITNIAKLVHSLDKEELENILLGYGYILYHAWKQSTIDVSINKKHSLNQLELSQSWATKSFEIGEKALNTFKRNSISWAYAVNHCVYVGIMTGVNIEKLDNYLKILLKLNNSPRLWTPRFDDTIGCYYLVSAERTWLTTEDNAKEFLKLDDNLTLARDYFNQAFEKDPGDIDIKEHIGRLTILENKINKYKRSK